MKRILLMLAFALVALAGCKKDPAPGPGPGLTPDTPTTIVFKTSRAVGETITLGFIGSEIQNISMDGAKAEDVTVNHNWRIFKLKLTSQTVTVRGDITTFHCRDNGIIEITLTKDLKLFDFDCSYNELTSLDVSGLEKLEMLACSSNKLTSLNIEGCESLYYVECYRNSIKDEAMTDVVNDLPTLGAPGVGRFVVTAEGCGNVITEDDIDIAVDKNWDVVDDKYNSLSQEPTPIVKVSEISITMSKYEVKVGYMVRATATVSPEDAENREVTWSSSNTAIARVRVVAGNNNAADVIGVSPGTVIITATAKDGSGVTASVPVTVIDDGESTYQSITITTSKAIGETIAMTVQGELAASEVEGAVIIDSKTYENGNTEYTFELTKQTVTIKQASIAYILFTLDQITSVDLNNSPDLKSLYCYMNAIKGENMTNLVKSLPDRTGKTAGKIIVYASNDSREKNVITKDDVAIAKAKNWNVLDSSNNKYEGI